MFFFTADTHFGHANIIKFCDRPFEDVNEMDERLIENWNARITNHDTVFIMGDMFFKSETDPEHTLARLKGHKHLILGNHDFGWLAKLSLASKYFESVDNYKEYAANGRNYVMCHYPLVSYRHDSKWYMIHGHIHNDKNLDFWDILKNRPRILNAGVDVNNFYPVTFEELEKNNTAFKETQP